MAALRLAKKELRALTRQRLSQLPMDILIKQSTIATKNLLSLAEYQNAKGIGIYLSMPRGEISTEDIVRNAFKQGKQVFVPYLYKPHSQESASTRSVMDMIALHSMSDFDSLKPDSWGIPSIPENSVKERRWVLEGNLESETIAWEKFSDNQSSCRPELTAIKALDMIVMPGVAFDESLGRLGHGKGFYDYFLSRYQGSMAGPLPFLVGLSLDVQLIPGDRLVPTGASDHRLDALVVGNGMILRRY